MYKITEKVALNPTVTKMVIEAPLIQELWFEDGTCRTSWRAPRPIPEDDDFFENVWRSYRETGNIY